MSESGSGDDRERLGREPGESGRTDSGSSEEPGRGYRSGSEADYQRGRADAEASQRPAQSQQYPPSGSHTQSTGKGWGIAALIVSILGFLLSFIGLVSLIISVPGLILGIVARRKGSRGLGLASIILSVLAILISIAITVILGAVLMNSPEFQQMLQEAQ